MFTRPFFCFAIVMGVFNVWLGTPSGQSAASAIQEEVSKADPILLNKKVVLENPPYTREFRGEILLEPQEVGSTVRIQLEIVNSTESFFSFARFRRSHRDGSFEISAREFPPGVVVSAVLEVKVGNGYEDGNNNYPVFFEDENGDTVGTIACVVPAKNRLFFGSSSYGVLDVAEGVVEYKIPVYYSAPIQFDNLSVVLPDDAFGNVELTTSLEPDGQHQALLVLRLHSESLTESVSTGIIKVVDSASGKAASETFHLRKQLPVEVLPTVLQFVDVPDAERVRASAIVRANLQQKVEEENREQREKVKDVPEKAPELFINVGSAGKTIPAKVVQLGSGLARVTIEMSSAESESLKEIDWDIKVDKVAYLLQTKVDLPGVNADGEDLGKASIFDAMFANFDAWQQGDVLVEITETYDSLAEADSGQPSGVVVKRTRWIRTAFDYRRQKFLQHELVDSSTTDFESETVDPVHERKWDGWTIDLAGNVGLRNGSNHREGRIRLAGEREGRIRLANEKDVRGLYQSFYDYRGLAVSGLGARGDSRETYIKATQALLMGELFVNATDGSEDTVEVKFFLPFNEEFERNGERLFAKGMQGISRFDKSSLMKIHEGSDLVIGKVLPKEEFVSERRFEWKEIDGVVVPHSYSHKKREGIWVNRREEHCDASVSAKFHWFRLNEPLPDKFFDGAELEDEEAFLKMVLPAKAGATSLIDDSDGGNQQKE